MTNEEFIKSVSLYGEEWRNVVGYENFYMVSSFGRIFSLKRTIHRKNGSCYNVKSKILSPRISSHNGILYAYICLRNNGTRKVVAIHRLVAQAFIPNPNSYPEVDHIDRNGINNNVDNLRWCTRSMNMNNEKTKIVVSISRHRRKLPTLYKPVVQLDGNKVMNTFCSITEASKSTGYSSGAIVTVCKGRRNTHKGYKWMYLSDYETLINQNVNERLPND